ncbi:MAG TPA: metallophosphoesterase [archaeon]|nr:metallophosphoesterase [archaeon]
MSYPVLYVTDVHGDEAVYEALLDKAMKNKVKAIIIGGDATPLMAIYAVNSIQIQRNFLEMYLIPLLENFQKISKMDIYMMMGNDDYKLNMDVLNKAEKKGILKVMHEKLNKIGDWNIVGYSCINPSDFLIFPIQDWVKKEDDIYKDLERITKDLDLKKTILSVHPPPKDTQLDVLYDGNHVGSKSLRKFIEKTQPYLVLGGHIHESPTMTGKIKENIGKTVCIQPGNAKITLIDLDEPGKAKRV